MNHSRRFWNHVEERFTGLSGKEKTVEGMEPTDIYVESDRGKE